MDYPVILLTALGLAMDCLAVSLSCGMVMPDFRVRDALRLGLFFGSFQVMMVAVGWAGGSAFAAHVGAIGHWIAFILLLAIGLKMVHEGMEEDEECASLNIRNIRVLLILSVATSIDALAVGISYALLDIDILVPAMIIGTASFALAFAGGTFGGRLGERFGKRMEIAGGIILIMLGVKILVENTLFTA